MNTFVKFITQDWSINKFNTKGRVFTFCFRLVNFLPNNLFAFLLLLPFRFFYKVIFEWVVGIEVPHSTKIGKGLRVFHLYSLVVNRNVVIGENCILRQSTTIGDKTNDGLCPKIGNNVNIGANVCIIGDISIGDNVTIGAGSVVVKNIPPNSIVAGNPARVIKVLEFQSCF